MIDKKEIYFKNLVLVVIYSSFLILFWPFKASILFAGLFALALTPLMYRFKKHIKKEETLILLMVTALLTIFIVPISIIVTKGLINFAQVQQGDYTQMPLYKNIETAISAVWDYANGLAGNLDINLTEIINLKAQIPKILQFVVPLLTSLVTYIPGFVLQLVIFIICLYFFMLKREKIFHKFQNSKLLSEGSLHQMSRLLQRVCSTVVVSTIVVASVQALIITVAAAIAGYENLLILFMLTFFMSFIPVIGSAPISISLVIYSFMQGHVASGLALVGAAVLAGVIDNIIRAYLLSSEEEAIHPLISLITLIGAMAMFGILGLFLGPIITELAFTIGGIMAAPGPVAALLASESTPPSSQ